MPARTKLTIFLISVAAISGAFFRLAEAQDEGEPAAAAAPADEATVGVRERAELTAAEMQAEAQRTRSRADSVCRRIMAMLDEARRERDMLRITCLNDKLSQCNATAGNISDRVQRLEDSLAADNAPGARHESTVLSVYAESVHVLDQESAQCIGEDIFETGPTQVLTDVEANTAREDATEYDMTPGGDTPEVTPYIPVFVTNDT